MLHPIFCTVLYMSSEECIVFSWMISFNLRPAAGDFGHNHLVIDVPLHHVGMVLHSKSLAKLPPDRAGWARARINWALSPVNTPG